MRAWPTILLSGILTGTAAAQTVPPSSPQPSVTTLPPVEVVGTSPLIGAGIDRNTVPAQTHVLDSSDLRREGTANLLNSLNQQVSGVTTDSASGNPFQPTLLYHGFAASGLQGTPQGLAVYINGVRFNQPFGDTVEWDLVPDIAIDRINLEGSNPVFGLNALGGSVNVQMKNGFTWQGAEASVSGGSFGQIQSDFQYGRQAATSRPTSPARCCTRTAGATCSRRICRTSTAMSAGAASAPNSTSTSLRRIPR